MCSSDLKEVMKVGKGDGVAVPVCGDTQQVCSIHCYEEGGCTGDEEEMLCCPGAGNDGDLLATCKGAQGKRLSGGIEQDTEEPRGCKRKRSDEYASTVKSLKLKGSQCPGGEEVSSIHSGPQDSGVKNKCAHHCPCTYAKVRPGRMCNSLNGSRTWVRLNIGCLWNILKVLNHESRHRGEGERERNRLARQ